MDPMTESKVFDSATVVPNGDENDYELDDRSPMKGTNADAHEMNMLGKTQQLNVS
jgi:hypothetical protein